MTSRDLKSSTSRRVSSYYYRAMHVEQARYCYRKSSSICLSIAASHSRKAFSNSAYTVAWSVRLSRSRTLLKPLDGTRCHLAGTLVWSEYNIVLDRGPAGPHRKERFEGGNPPVKICIANCGQGVTESGMIAVYLLKLSNALSNGTIANQSINQSIIIFNVA